MVFGIPGIRASDVHVRVHVFIHPSSAATSSALRHWGLHPIEKISRNCVPYESPAHLFPCTGVLNVSMTDFNRVKYPSRRSSIVGLNRRSYRAVYGVRVVPQFPQLFYDSRPSGQNIPRHKPIDSL